MRLLALLFAFAVPYSHIQADVSFAPQPPGSHTTFIRIHLHNTGDIAASCVVKAGAKQKITGVSANGDAFVFFDALPNYNGYTISCSVN